jgi:hypothetical protein
MVAGRLAQVLLSASALCFAASPAAAQPLVYVTDGSSPAGLHVINTQTGNRVASLAPGDGPLDVVASPDGTTVYVTTATDLVVFDALTLAERRRITIGRTLVELALTADGTRLHVAQGVANRQFPPDYRILTFDTATMSQAGADISLPLAPARIAVAPDGSRLFALSLDGDRTLYLIDLASRTIAGTMTTELGAKEIIVHPDGSAFYIAYSTGTTSEPNGDRLGAYNASTLAETGMLVLPDFRALVPVFFPYFYPSAVGQMAILPGGDRLYLPRVAQGWRTSPTAYLRHEQVLAFDLTGGAPTISATLTPPVITPYAGAIAATVSSASPHVFVAGAGGASGIDPATGTITVAGPAVSGAASAAAAPAPPCWFDVGHTSFDFHAEGGQISRILSVPDGCAWTSSAPDWINRAPASGTGSATMTVSVGPSIEPRSGTLTINGQAVSVHQRIPITVIESPVGGAEVTLPFDISGWAVRRSTDPPVAPAGVWDVLVSAIPEGGQSDYLGRASRHSRPDVAAAFGAAYALSGFTRRIGRLPPGRYAFLVEADTIGPVPPPASAMSSSAGLTFATSSAVTVTVRRQPLVAIDAPAAGAVVQQPFELRGWAADMTAPTGMGVDAVHVWAYPIAGGLPILAGAAAYGQDRGDLQAFFGFGPITAGYRLSVSGLPVGTYTLVAFAHSPQTNAFDASASVVVTVTGPPPGAPFGLIDTPVSNATVAGAIGITGWALDDTGVTRVVISRAPMGSETGDVYVGDATFVAGVRPDLTAAYPAYPHNDRGWGLMVLTNMLPGGGNGTVTFHADANDAAGNMVRLGSRMVNAANAASDLPFGTLDTPASGAAVSGTVPVFGWALSPTSLIPLDGSTIDVLIDDVVVGRPSYNLCRGTVGTSPAPGTCNDDIATLFGTSYPNIAQGSGAIGVYMLDTTTLTNGLHTIAWRVTDGNGRTQGIGSRYFVVQNP